MYFIEKLKENGWSEAANPHSFSKGIWSQAFDTSSWIEVGTENTQRVFDVAVPEEKLYQWTINLISHLFTTDDLLVRKNK